MDKTRYAEYVGKKMKKSPLAADAAKAFAFGGAICAFGQGLLEFWRRMGLDKNEAASATSVTLIVIGSLLTGLSLYDDLAKHGGAGTLIPITGFANSVASPAMEFKSEGLVLGMAAKMFIIAGPVIVYGIAASSVYGLILYIVGLIR